MFINIHSCLRVRFCLSATGSLVYVNRSLKMQLIFYRLICYVLMLIYLCDIRYICVPVLVHSECVQMTFMVHYYFIY